MSFNSIDPQTGLTVFGLSTQSAEDLLHTLNSNVISNLIQETGNPLITTDTSEFSVVGRLNKVFANHLADMWTYVKDIERSMYVETASGANLSKLALLVGVTRKIPTASRGQLSLTGTEGTNISTNIIFTSLRGDSFRLVQPEVITMKRCISIGIELASSIAGRTHEITLDNRVFTSTNTNPLADFLAQLEDDVFVDVTLGNNILTITQKDVNTPMSVELSQLLKPVQVTVDVDAISVEKGLVFGDSRTIVNILTPTTGLISVNNREDFILGDTLESDAQFRQRIGTETTSIGTSTLNAIESLLLNNPSVAALHIEVNSGFEIDIHGIPPKSFEIIIHHVGDDEGAGAIAEDIWRNKPLGIYSHGNNVFTVQDLRGIDHQIRYTLADVLEVYIRVTYKELVGDNEVLPEDVVNRIQEGIVIEGGNYRVAQNVIGKRFYGAIFRVADGISEVDVTVALRPQGATPPTASMFQPVGVVNRTQIATFALNRITVTKG